MKKILMQGAEIELYFGTVGGVGQWFTIEARTDIAFAFDFNSRAGNEAWKKYTHWAWLNEEEHIYMLFHEKDLMP